MFGRLKHAIIRYYKKLKIKNKFFLFISSIMLLTFSFVVVGFHFIIKTYEVPFYQNSSQLLSTSSGNIERELKKVEEISEQIAVDPNIQNLLTSINPKMDRLEQYRIRREIENILISYVGNEKFIRSVYLVDLNRNIYMSGIKDPSFLNKNINKIISQLKKTKGENIWIEKMEETYFTSSRKIRSYTSLDFNDLGYLIIRVNLDKITEEATNDSLEGGESILISNKNTVFYAKGNLNTELKAIDFSKLQDKNYTIWNINGKRYFICQKNSKNYSGWDYWHIIPYEKLFLSIEKAKHILYSVFIIMFAFVFLIGFLFSERITRPIGKLVSAMQKVEIGDFNAVRLMESSHMEKDEIGVLYRNFISMVNKVDNLIQENYVKKLLIEKTKFEALQAQINPHFLYNTLESINWMAKMNKQWEISIMAESLGFLLRNALNTKETITSLEKELTFVQKYIIIQKYRFEERLNYQVHVPEHLLYCKIPKLSIQPIVENSIKHVLETSLETCSIQVTGTIVDSNVFIIVEDDGPGIDPFILKKIENQNFESSGNSIGLKNIDDRIKMFFGKQYGIEVSNAKTGGARVTISLPYLLVDS
ncbi:sensor histidine kinase [Caldifermentibacillus hisashii]|uniref:sensor histidine kinase n=1 Tax=Caldifermentibacillus hisashii TaxID=996558 RepID=UPI0031FC49C3